MEPVANKASIEAVSARLDVLSEQVAYLVERQRKQEELFAEMTPILKEVMTTATGRLFEMDKKGYFEFGREVVGVFEKVVEGYQPDDVRKLGDAIVGILDTVRALTQPSVLAIAGEASEVLQNADAAQPIGIVGMVRATRDDDVQKGMSVMLEVLRHVGRGAKAVADQRREKPKRRAPLEALAPKQKRVLGTERPAEPAAKAAPRPKITPARAEGAACGVPAEQGEVAAVMDGVGFTADGHLADPSTWHRALGEQIAAALGITLDEARWKIVDFARDDFQKSGAAPNVRRITQGAGVTTKELYALFPKAPARTIAKIAGIPKPAGCL